MSGGGGGDWTFGVAIKVEQTVAGGRANENGLCLCAVRLQGLRYRRVDEGAVLQNLLSRWPQRREALRGSWLG